MFCLTLNAGSSSLKYQLFQNKQSILSGLVEKIGEPGAAFKTHQAALADLNATLLNTFPNSNIECVAHRVVHGGTSFSKPTLITPENIETLKALIPLAPLHNPANIAGIETSITCFPNAKQVAIFDTAFHRTLPEQAYTYAIDQKIANTHHIRKYGFHGTSHQYVSKEAAKQLNKPLENCELISLHLGNGASACAIKGGVSIDTSMGMTPLAGLCMGTRSGDIDPAIPLMLSQTLSLNELERLFNHHSGLKGLCGENDMRTIESRANSGDSKAALAIEVFVYKIQTTIGSYLSQLPHCDAIIFTGGIGENAHSIREAIIQPLTHFGIGFQSTAPIQAMVIKTNEELQMCILASELLSI